MDFKAFFTDVEQWIQQANQEAVKRGIESEGFWLWVAASASDICDRYNNHRLAIKQMLMLSDWLEEVYNRKRQS